MYSQGQLLATLALAATQILAFDRTSVPETVQAGTDVTITNTIDTDNSFDSDYRVYLSVSAPNVGQGPCCTLVNETAINDTSVTINIPPSVGPSGADVQPYAIVIMQYNTDHGGNSGYEYSNGFALLGGTGVFTPYEEDQLAIGNPDWIPCTAYDCARQCSQKNWKGNLTTDDDPSFKATYDCIAKCPGTTYPPWEDENDDGDENGDASSTGSSSTTNTATSTASSGPSSASSSGTGGSSHTSSATTSSSETGAATNSSTASGEAGALYIERRVLALAGVASIALMAWL